MLVGISGKMRSGKDTVANYIIEKYGFEHLKFSKGINEIYNKYNYVDDGGVKNRQALQGIGPGFCRRGILKSISTGCASSIKPAGTGSFRFFKAVPFLSG